MWSRPIQTENIEAPGGRIVRGPTELGVRTLGRVERVEEFSNIIIKNVGGAPIRVRDVGYAEDGMAEKRTLRLLQGQARGDAGCAPADRHEYRQGRGRHYRQARRHQQAACRPA